MALQEKTKGTIRDALLELMHTKDVEQISVMELAKKSGISRATIYRYYSSIEEILEEVEELFLEELRNASRYFVREKLDLTHLERPHPAYVKIAGCIRKNREIILRLSSAHGDMRFATRAQNMFSEFFISQTAFEGINVSDMDVYLAYAQGGNFAIVQYWLEKRQDLSDEEVAVIMQKLLYAPLIYHV